MDSAFLGEVALVTGGNSGIGRATALAFAQRGARVVIASRRPEESAETVQLIAAAGGDALFVKTDVTQAAQVEALVASTLAHFGRLDYAVNSAGIGSPPFVLTEDYPEETWDSVIDINLKGTFLSMKYELPPIVQAKGAIVNIASVAGLRGGRLGVAYYASKHGVVGMTRAAALEYADKGVRINAVAPAVIQTPMSQWAIAGDSAQLARVMQTHPLGRIGNPDEVAQAAVWLCSRAASFTTGHILAVDGGRLAQSESPKAMPFSERSQ
jgi:NAD(P)-dependent dehydrogenase (short-subunit alcohol dehydrogenase family)